MNMISRQIHKTNRLLQSILAKHKPYIAVEIEPEYVSLMQLRQVSNSEYKIQCYARCKRDIIGAAGGNSDEKYNEHIPELQALVQRNNLHGYRAVMALPKSQIVEKNVMLDIDSNMYQQECDIKVRLSDLFGIQDNELCFDFTPLPGSLHTRDTHKVVAAKKQAVQSTKKMLEAAGLAPHVLEVDCYAWERSLPQLKRQLASLKEDDVIGLFDIQPHKITFVAFHNDKHIYIRTQRITQMKEQDEPFNQLLFHQLESSLQLFFTTSAFHELHHMVLAGELANVEGLQELCQENLLVKTVVADPIQSLRMGAQVDQRAIQNDSHALVSLYGLALRGQEACEQ